VSVGPSNIETEIKLRAPDAAAAAELLTTHGFVLSNPRTHETNSLYDTETRDLQSSGRMLRVREAGGVCKLTFKGPANSGRHKMREEFEVEISDARTLKTIIQRLGYQKTFSYEKFRTEFDDDGRGTAVLDETPIGVFLELEGATGWIDASAARLGFTESDYITSSYGRLYLEWCDEHHLTPGYMLWPESPAL
jgi:adenylate cyclase class 2